MKFLSTLIRFVFLGIFLYLLTNGNIKNWFIIFSLTLILAVVFGRFYCGYICPMNTLMIYTEKFSQKFGIQRKKIPKIFQWKYMSAIIFFLTIIIMIVSKKVLDKNIPIILVFLIFSVITTIFFKQELFHNQFCPFGFLQSLFGRRSIYSYKVEEEKCIGCKLCEKSCPTKAIKVMENKKAIINKELCLQCGNCKEVCPKNAINYKR